MPVTRRSALKGTILASAAIAAPLGRARLDDRPALAVYDSNQAARPTPLGGAQQEIDVAWEGAHRWRALRAAQPAGRVVGLTSWSDLVQVRDCLREQGLRLVSCAQRGRLFYWEMA